MRKNYFTKMLFLLAFVLTCSFANAQDIDELFSLDKLNLIQNNDRGWDEESNYVGYDDNGKITYSYQGVTNDDGELDQNGWGYAGWDFRGDGNADLSAYSSITIFFEGEFDEEGEIEFTIKYEDSEEIKTSKRSPGTTQMTINLDADYRQSVEYVYLKSQKSGTITIIDVRATAEGELDLYFTDIAANGWKDGGDEPSHYDENYGAIVFSGDEKWVDWDYGNGGANYAEYDYIRIDFEYESDFDVTLEVTYNPENEFAKSIVTAPKGSTFIAVPLNKNVPGEYDRGNDELGGGIRDIYVRASLENETNIYLYVTRVYLAKGECPVMPKVPMADLVVTGLSWTPNAPVLGDQVVFSARVKNIGDRATDDNKKHGLVFQIWNGEEYATVLWSDNHYSSVAPGESVILTATGGPGEVTSWLYGSQSAYELRALVNDDNNILESDATNNYSDVITIEPIAPGEMVPVGDYVGIEAISAIEGYVFVENGTLNIIGYPSNASVSVYNLLGQKIQQKVLSSGAYIVEVNVSGRTYIHKVLVK